MMFINLCAETITPVFEGDKSDGFGIYVVVIVDVTLPLLGKNLARGHV